MDRPPSALPAGLVLAQEGFDSDGPRWVVARAEEEIVLRYGWLDDSERDLTAAMFDPPDGAFLVVRRGGAAGPPVGGVGVRTTSPGIGEVRRLWIEPGWRGRGISRLLMAELEDASRDLGLTALSLETGPLQHEAVALYQATGWRQIVLDEAVYGYRFTKRLVPRS